MTASVPQWCPWTAIAPHSLHITKHCKILFFFFSFVFFYLKMYISTNWFTQHSNGNSKADQLWNSTYPIFPDVSWVFIISFWNTLRRYCSVAGFFFNLSTEILPPDIKDLLGLKKIKQLCFVEKTPVIRSSELGQK